MTDILLLQPEPRAFAALSGALEPHYRVGRIQDGRELERHLRRQEPRGTILDIFDCTPPIPLTTLRLIRRKHPSVALMVAADFTGREMELYHLGRLSVDGVIRLDEAPSAREIRSVVGGALSASLAQVVVETVAGDLPPLAKEAIRWAIEHAEARPQVSDLAAALAMTPRSILREASSMNLPTPRTLLLWGRLIQATYLLERPHETVESVAYRLGYATGGTLRKALRRHMGCSPTTLLRRGGLAWTLEVFQRKGLR
ncbi:helix-turn-helix domain-containing protein [Gemmatimonadota bacterium]